MAERPQMNKAQAEQAKSRIEAMKRQFEQKRNISEVLSKVKFKIGVYSGKGGVGKTTVSANLATSLAYEGAKVGILDVDVDCPNVVNVMKISEPPVVGPDRKMIPPERFGVKVMSLS